LKGKKLIPEEQSAELDKVADFISNKIFPTSGDSRTYAAKDSIMRKEALTKELSKALTKDGGIDAETVALIAAKYVTDLSGSDGIRPLPFESLAKGRQRIPVAGTVERHQLDLVRKDMAEIINAKKTQMEIDNRLVQQANNLGQLETYKKYQSEIEGIKTAAQKDTLVAMAQLMSKDPSRSVSERNQAMYALAAIERLQPGTSMSFAALWSKAYLDHESATSLARSTSVNTAKRTADIQKYADQKAGILPEDGPGSSDDMSPEVPSGEPAAAATVATPVTPGYSWVDGRLVLTK
jgi:hypothetical protein